MKKERLRHYALAVLFVPLWYKTKMDLLFRCSFLSFFDNLRIFGIAKSEQKGTKRCFFT